MKKNQTSVRNGIEDFLCPFTDMYITQGADGDFSHKGTMANDVRGKKRGIKYPYYAPVTCKCLKVYPDGGGSKWQSLEKVRFSNGRVDYATFIIYHDETQDCYVDQVVHQGKQIGNMGKKGNVTGVHCHIEIEQGKDTTFKKNKYGVYSLNNEVDTDDCYFCDDTNIMNMKNANWKYLSDVPVSLKYKSKYILNIRTNAGTIYPIKLVKNIPEDLRNNLTSSNIFNFARLKKDTEFEVLEIIKNNKGTWAKTKYGFIAIEVSGKEYSVKC